MCVFSRKWCFPSVCFLFSCILAVGELPGAEATATEAYNISVDIGTLGRLFSPGSLETGSYRNLENVEWFLYVTDPTNLELYVYPKHVDLEACCDSVTITTMASYTSATGDTPVMYTGQVSGQVSRAALVALPTVHSTTGMLKIAFISDNTLALSGFALRFFALHKFRVVPSAYASLPAFPTIRQLVVEAYIPEFTITLSASQRLWLQVIHMNLSIVHATQFTECQYQTEKLEFYDTYCSMDNCNLGIICRHSYSVTPITLVSWGHQVSVRSSCAQPGTTDCAIINYKIHDPVTGMGTCGPGDPRGFMYQQISEYWDLVHTWHAQSNPSDLDKTWWIQNTNSVAELLIQIMENQLSLGPDCASERVEIYSGDCITDNNRVTYFCGEVMDSYKLTVSRIAAIRFIGDPSSHQYSQLRFSLRIFAGSVAVSTPNPNPNQGYGAGGGILIFDLSNRRSSSSSDLRGLWVALIVLAILASAASAALRYRIYKKKKAKIHQQQLQLQSRLPTTEWVTPLYIGWEGPGIPPAATYDPPHSIHATGMQPPGLQPTGMQPPGLQATGMQPPGLQPTGMQPPGIQPTGMQPPGLQHHGIQPTGFQHHGFQPNM